MADEEVIGGKWTLDVSDLKSGLSEANRLIRVADSEFKASAASIGDWTKSADGLTAKMNALNTIVDVQEQKVSALKEQYTKVAAEKGENSKAAQELEIRLNNETAALNKSKFELDQNKTALEKLSDPTDELKKKQEELKNKTESLTSSMNELGKKALVAVTAAATAAGAALFKLMTDSGKFADDLITMSNKTGISVQQLQELQYASRFVDVEVETMTGSMNKLTKSMDAARDSMSTGKLNDQAKAYQALGIQVTNADGTLRNNKDVFYEVIDALGKVTNETERDQLAMQLLGKSATELNPLIKAGSSELNRLAKEANDVGAVVSDDAVTALGQFDDNMETLKASTQGLMNDALAQLTPVINDLVNSLKENMPAIIDGIKGFVTFVIDNGPLIISTIGGIAAGLLAWNIISMINGVVSAIKAFQLANEGATIAQWALNAAQTANPIGAVIAGIVALVAGIIILWNTNEGFRKFITNTFDNIVKTISGAVDNIVKFFTVTIPNTLKSVGDWFKDIGENIVKGVWDGITGMAGWIGNKVSGFFGGIVDGAKKFLGIKSPSKVFAGIGEYMAQGLGVGFTDEMRSVNKDIQGAIPTSIGANINAGAIASNRAVATGSNVNFTQNIYSPKPLTAYEVYRQTKNASQALALGVVK
ncbi:MAG: hypothetical protein WHF31_15195 [Candidatus Dehalobacter alkaniphilus]